MFIGKFIFTSCWMPISIVIEYLVYKGVHRNIKIIIDYILFEE